MEQKRSLQAAFNKQWGRIRPAGRQFDMPGLNDTNGWIRKA